MKSFQAEVKRDMEFWQQVYTSRDAEVQELWDSIKNVETSLDFRMCVINAANSAYMTGFEAGYREGLKAPEIQEDNNP